MIKVYIASPYGGKKENVHLQMHEADKLIKKGFNVFIPLLFHFQNDLHFQDEGLWMKMDLEWIESCDCLYAPFGESPGVILEKNHAQKNNIPIFETIEEIEYFRDFLKNAQYE